MAKVKNGMIENPEELDPNFYFGIANFTLPNGDNYSGEYCAHTSGLIWRNGYGTYTTKDGHTYEGMWRHDKLLETSVVHIKYVSGAEYHGPITQNKYSGAGIYTLDSKMDLNCQFIENKPVKDVILIDLNGRIWSGKHLYMFQVVCDLNGIVFSIPPSTSSVSL